MRYWSALSSGSVLSLTSGISGSPSFHAPSKGEKGHKLLLALGHNLSHGRELPQ